jgi:CubicO group peptidase (beta-lactamase class C family)
MSNRISRLLHALIATGALIATAFHVTGLGAAPLEHARPDSVGMDAERLERLDGVLEQYVENDQIAGAVALVARRGRIVYLNAVGERDREARSEMKTDAMFRIASQTKAIVSTTLMTLVEEGKVLISDPVSKYLPEFAHTTVAVAKAGGGYDVVPASRPITIRDLLTHTSGYSYGSGPAEDRWREAGLQGWYFADRPTPIRTLVAEMARLPADAQPGTQWIYGYNTDILGAVVEVVAGKPLDQVVAERIFAPLGMRDTHFYPPAAKANRLAAVYSLVDGALVRAPALGSVGQGSYIEGPRTSFSGGAGLVSTATDYARFLQMLLNGGELDGARVLGPKTVDLMTTNHIGDISFRPGQGFGLGFYVTEDVGATGEAGSVGEFGWGGAYHSTYWVDPAEQLVVVYLTQLIPATGVDDHEKLRALVYQAIVD